MASRPYPIGSMGLVYLPTFGLFFNGKCWQIYSTVIHGSYGYTSWFLRFLVLTYLLVSVNLAGKDSMGKTWDIWFVRRCIFIAGDDRQRFQLFLLHLRVTTLFWVFKNTQPGNSWCVKTGTQLTSRDPGKYPSSSPPNVTFFETQKRNRLHWICP